LVVNRYIIKFVELECFFNQLIAQLKNEMNLQVFI